MYKVIPLLFFFFSCAQSKLELEVLKALNHYRKVNYLAPVNISDALQKAANHHNQWMSLVEFSVLTQLMTNGNEDGLGAHYETIDVPNFKELFSPKERGEFYGALHDILSYSEICSITKAVDTKNPISPKFLSEERLAHEIIIKFSSSSDHNEEILQNIDNNSQIFVGISVITKNEIAYTTIFFVLTNKQKNINKQGKAENL